MRISDWSSDVCSSDLQHGEDGRVLAAPYGTKVTPLPLRLPESGEGDPPGDPFEDHRGAEDEIVDVDVLERMRGEQLLEALVEGNPRRSEEHTSELQSLMRISYAVFCLKKNKRPNRKKHKTRINRNKSNDNDITNNQQVN